MPSSNALDDLVGRELAAVTFIRDYIQLAFDGPLLTLILDLTVCLSNASYTRSDSRFCASLVALIGSQVRMVDMRENEYLSITFEGGESLRMSLHPEDYRFGPEAVTYRDSTGSLWVC